MLCTVDIPLYLILALQISTLTPKRAKRICHPAAFPEDPAAFF
jgi:hypothetical protein